MTRTAHAHRPTPMAEFIVAKDREIVPGSASDDSYEDDPGQLERGLHEGHIGSPKEDDFGQGFRIYDSHGELVAHVGYVRADMAERIRVAFRDALDTVDPVE